VAYDVGFFLDRLFILTVITNSMSNRAEPPTLTAGEKTDPLLEIFSGGAAGSVQPSRPVVSPPPRCECRINSPTADSCNYILVDNKYLPLPL
jgi:hypothetical protein